MTEKEAKLQWLKNRYSWLDKLIGPYITDIERLSSGKLSVTVTLSHLSGEQQSEIVQAQANRLRENPEFKRDVQFLVFV